MFNVKEKEYLVEIVYLNIYDNPDIYRGLHQVKNKSQAKEKAINYICYSDDYKRIGLRSIKTINVKRCIEW